MSDWYEYPKVKPQFSESRQDCHYPCFLVAVRTYYGETRIEKMNYYFNKERFCNPKAHKILYWQELPDLPSELK